MNQILIIIIIRIEKGIRKQKQKFIGVWKVYIGDKNTNVLKSKNQKIKMN